MVWKPTLVLAVVRLAAVHKVINVSASDENLVWSCIGAGLADATITVHGLPLLLDGGMLLPAAAGTSMETQHTHLPGLQCM